MTAAQERVGSILTLRIVFGHRSELLGFVDPATGSSSKDSWKFDIDAFDEKTSTFKGTQESKILPKRHGRSSSITWSVAG
jgi:hypothetical protein